MLFPHGIQRGRFDRGVVAMGWIGRDVHCDEGIGQTVGIFRLKLLGLDNLHVETNLRRLLVTRHSNDVFMLFVGNFKCILYVMYQAILRQLLIQSNVVDDFKQDLLVQLLNLAKKNQAKSPLAKTIQKRKPRKQTIIAYSHRVHHHAGLLVHDLPAHPPELIPDEGTASTHDRNRQHIVQIVRPVVMFPLLGRVHVLDSRYRLGPFVGTERFRQSERAKLHVKLVVSTETTSAEEPRQGVRTHGSVVCVCGCLLTYFVVILKSYQFGYMLHGDRRDSGA